LKDRLKAHSIAMRVFVKMLLYSVVQHFENGSVLLNDSSRTIQRSKTGVALFASVADEAQLRRADVKGLMRHD